MKEQIKYPFSEDQTFCIGLIKNTGTCANTCNEYIYFKNVKPIDKYIVDWVGEEEWELKFKIPQLSLGFICIVARLIDNKPDCISLASYFVSTKDDPEYIKERIINYELHKVQLRLSDLEEEKKELLTAYSKLSKYLLN